MCCFKTRHGGLTGSSTTSGLSSFTSTPYDSATKELWKLERFKEPLAVLVLQARVSDEKLRWVLDRFNGFGLWEVKDGKNGFLLTMFFDSIVSWTRRSKEQWPYWLQHCYGMKIGSKLLGEKAEPLHGVFGCIGGIWLLSSL